MLRLEREPHPGAELALRWLRQHLDDLKGRPACRTHGDLAFHNVLMHEDRVSAALDWEFTHYSDPLEDLVYVQPFIAELGLWDAFLERYIAGTGHSYDAAAAKLMRVFVLMRIIICNIGVLSTAMMPNVHDMPLFVAGGPLRHKFEIATLDALIEG
jgi:aminoglycoside phosphotransferase (APT) family kinase protein